MNKFEMKERIIERPYFYDWEIDGCLDGICSNGVINYEGLSDQDKMLLYVYAWNSTERNPGRNLVMKQFGWTAYKVGKLFKELKADNKISCVALFSERTWLLCGRGYQVNN